MPRSHPPTLITLVRAMLRERRLVARGTTVVVAVSGGPDSMALLHVLALLRRAGGFGLFAHGIDHGLRAEGAAELDVAEDFSRSLDVPFGRTVVSVPPGSNVQARARAARWGALETAAARVGAERIATGHHADDRAETMVMRILRGTGPRGLAVLPAQDGRRIRPMLRARRTDVDSHVQRHRIPHCIDRSNRDPRFLRVRVRFEVMPVLERLNPGVVDHMYALADGLAVPMNGLLDDRASKSAAGEPTELSSAAHGPGCGCARSLPLGAAGTGERAATPGAAGSRKQRGPRRG